jgi:hypothetical protein
MPKYTYTVTLFKKVWIHSTKLVDFLDYNCDAIGHVGKIIFILPLLCCYCSYWYPLFLSTQAEFDPSSSSDSDSDSGGLLHPSGSSHALSNGQVGPTYCYQEQKKITMEDSVFEWRHESTAKSQLLHWELKAKTVCHCRFNLFGPS